MTDLTSVELWIVTLCDVLLGVVFCAGCTANTLVLVVFYRKSGLRNIANRFVVNLMLVNIISCACLIPIVIADNGPGGSHVVCILAELTSVFCATGIVLSVLLIAVDQYFAVVDPLHYHSIVSSCRSALMILGAWCFSVLVALLAAVLPRSDITMFLACSNATELNETSTSFSPGETPRSSDLHRLVFSSFLLLLVFVAPFVLICFIYCRICAAASGNSKRTRKNGSNAYTNDELVISPLTEAKERSDEVSNASSKHDDISDDTVVEYPGRSRPSFVLTRPSPPRAETETAEDRLKSNASLPNLKIVKLESEVPVLKPTLKSNPSYTRLSSLHIQFSTPAPTQAPPPVPPRERRHSNVPLTTLDPEFENISKSRSPSIQSSSFELPSRSSSTRSTITSHGKTSRSSSVYSTLNRAPGCSRASSIRSTSSYIVHNIRHRISNASLFRYREEARAARISAMVIVMALVCWLPFFVLYYLRQGTTPFALRHTLPHYLDSLSFFLLLLSTVVSPCLFAFRNRKIKKEIRKIFRIRKNELGGRCPKSFYVHNFSLDLKTHTAELLLGLKRKSQQQIQK